MPIDYSKYDKMWFEVIRPDILRRDNYKCKNCSVHHKSFGYRDARGKFHECDQFMQDWAKSNGKKIIRIVLSVAHLDHDITNNDYSNLASLCQKCHINHDKAYKSIMRNKRKYK